MGISTSTAVAQTAGLRRGRRGQTVITFSMVFVLLMALLFTAFDFSYAVFVKATLHHAVREGVRFAIAGNTLSGMAHDASIKSVVKRNSLSLLTAPEDEATIQIRYYTANGFGATAVNGAGNIVVVSVENYEIPAVGPVLRTGNGYHVTVSALDKMEPFPGQPPARE